MNPSGLWLLRNAPILALVGMMGSGKSAVGRRLAVRLPGRRGPGRSFADLDDDIVAHAGRSIPEIFTADGETVFRERERAALAARLDRDEPLVLALGGGAFAQPAVRLALAKADAATVWLDVPFATLRRRLEGEGTRTRPLLARPDWPERLAALLAERETFYRQAALRLKIAPRESVPATVARLAALALS